jgi:hypothetical protein
MASTSEIHSESFDDNNSSEVDTLSVLLSSVETEADTGSIPTTRTIQTRQLSSIHKHTRTATKEEKAHTKKRYFCKYCPPQDPKGHHSSTVGLQGHLRKHDIEWNPAENQERMTAKDQGERSLLELYQKLLARGEVQGLEGEVLKRTAHQNTIKQALLDLIIVRRLPFSCVEWLEFHAFVKALN